MDINEIYSSIDSIREDIIGHVELYLMENDSGKRVYYFVDTGSVQEEVFEMVMQSLRRLKTKQVDQQPYDLISVNGIHYTLALSGEENDYDEVSNVCKIICDYTNETDESSIMKDLTDINLKNVKAYLVKVKLKGRTYIFGSEVSSLAKIKRTGFLANLSDHKLKRLERDDVVGFNSEVGIIVDTDNVLIIKPQLFETLFDIDVVIEKKAATTFKNLKEISEKFSEKDIVHIRNIEKILVAAKANKRINKRLAKVNKEEGLINALFENIEAVWLVLESKEFKDEFSSIEYDKESNTITITSGSIDKFLTLLCDAPYESIIGKKKRLDRAR
ncbi:Kiwa anti-phage protein KwaB-like domain-containing protein [Listeria rustica]|uniref:DUF4868 domain-containing protein n=1 Tax=Listeria rustica TaxID=2713503 RepID=A0A7W1T647_9LIST|nr:Kiwa anti-phage protein KwaB-like domain-containing protein [Listeria rustica]MBA3926114.1 DUF4868 domain-containing protein [Listeria rustica]